MSGIDALPVSGGPTIGVSAPSGNVKQPRPPAEKMCYVEWTKQGNRYACSLEVDSVIFRAKIG
jgi:hypothetical protein